jgi:hypothetical protein
MAYLHLRPQITSELLPQDPPALSSQEAAQVEEWGSELIVTKDIETSLAAIIDMLPSLENGYKYQRFLPQLEEIRQGLEVDRLALEHKLQWGND